MKRQVIFTLLTISTCINYTYAQYIATTGRRKTVKQDTINIRGIVFDARGNPVPNILLISKNKQIYYQGYNLYTVTDTEGKFKLEGALVKDTINIRFWENDLNIINNGSRYLEINLPPSNQKIPIKNSIQISAQRKYQKRATPTFKVITNAVISDYYGFPITNSASFPGDLASFTTYIENRINYSEKAIANNVEGEVEISFTIDRDGLLKDFKILRGIGYGCEEQVIDVINKTRWKPGIFNGKPVATQSSITINFKLTDK